MAVAAPYFAGERTPIFDPSARGVVAGLTLSHGRAELYRAARTWHTSSPSDNSRRMGRTVGKEAEGTGAQALVDKINDLVRQGNVRRIVVTDRSDRKILDIPVNAGLIAAAVAPMLTVAGTALALVGGWRITVEKTEPDVVPGEPDA